jgi:hypothetical protein
MLVYVAARRLMRKERSMTKVVTFGYAADNEQHPPLLEQLSACREYARAKGYMVLGEYNEINEADHPATGAALRAMGETIAQGGAEMILVYQPTPTMQEKLSGFGLPIEAVGPMQRSVAA